MRKISKNSAKILLTVGLLIIFAGLYMILNSLGIINRENKTLSNGNLTHIQECFIDYQPTQQNPFSQLYMDNIYFSFSKIETTDHTTGTVDIEITYPNLELILDTAISDSVNKKDDYSVILDNTAKRMKALMHDKDNQLTASVTADVIIDDGKWALKPNNVIQDIIAGNLTDILKKFLSERKWGEIK